MKLNKINLHYIQDIVLRKEEKLKAPQHKEIKDANLAAKIAPDKVTSKNLKKIVMSLPDVRGDKVKSIKKSISKGTYRIESRHIASKMVRSLLLNRIWGK